MAQNDLIGRLFTNVLNEDVRQYCLNQADIRTGIQNMKEVYKPNPTSLSSQFLDVANYNDPSHRCAYLHKYAPFHTAMVADLLKISLENQDFKRIVQQFLLSTGRINLCSLGGGPGSDVLGVISALSGEFGSFQLSATIVDCMENWKTTFCSLIKELRHGYYGDLGYSVQPQYFDWDYIGHNLLAKMSNNVNKAIQGAHLVTMVKFVSAAACKDTSEMLKKIFRSLKPGSLVLYIDNAGGGFHQLIKKCAHDCSMNTVYGPVKHQLYSNSSFNVQRFGYTPCLETKVTIHVWRKSTRNTFCQGSIVNSDYNGITPRIQGRPPTAINNTFNQYNIVNTNIFYTNITIPNASENIPSHVSQKYVFNQRQSESENWSLGQRQPQLLPIQKQFQLPSIQRQYQLPSIQRQPQLPSIERQPQIPSIQRQPQLPSIQRQHKLPPIQRQPQRPPVHRQPQSQTSPTVSNQQAISSYGNRPEDNYSNELDCCSCCVIS